MAFPHKTKKQHDNSSKRHVLPRAKTMWFAGMQHQDIARELDISPVTIGKWVTKYKWDDELNMIGSAASIALVDKVRKRLEINLSHRFKSLDKIQERVHDMLESGDELTPAELEKLINVMSGLLKVEKMMLANGYSEDPESDRGDILAILRGENLAELGDEVMKV